MKIVMVPALIICLGLVSAAVAGEKSASRHQSWNIDSLQEDALKGNADAQYRLAVAFSIGEGVPQSNYEAMRWYLRAADGGNANAQHALGSIYQVGAYGATRDISRAYYWYRKAAEQGFMDSMITIGNMLWTGENGLKDYKQAVTWFTKAAEKGDIDSQATLGIAYRDGLGVEIDYTEAAMWLKKAATQGHPGAQFSLGMMYSVGKGVPQDEEMANMWFSKAERARPETRWDIRWMLQMKGLLD